MLIFAAANADELAQSAEPSKKLNTEGVIDEPSQLRLLRFASLALELPKRALINTAIALNPRNRC